MNSEINGPATPAVESGPAPRRVHSDLGLKAGAQTLVLQRDSNLDLLRCIAITIVVIAHVVQMSPVSYPAMQRVTDYGRFGVDLFFVLSGWLIGSLFWRELKETQGLDLPRFLIRRWFRTIPPYLAAMILAWFAVAHSRSEPFDWGYLLFVQNYYERVPFFLASWSLCIEEHFYVFFPLIAVCLFSRRLLMCLVFITALVVSPLGRFVMSADGSVPAAFGFAHTATHLRLEGLLLGFGASFLPSFAPGLFMQLKRRSKLLLLVGCCALAVVPTLNHLWLYRVGLLLISAGYILVLLWMVGAEALPLARFKIIKAIAIVSYSTYLTHGLMIHVARAVVAKFPSVQPFGYFPVVTVLIAGASVVFFYAVERTSIVLRDRWCPRKGTRGISEGQPQLAGVV